MLNTPSIPLLDLTSLPKDGSGEETTFASESQHKSRDTWQKAVGARSYSRVAQREARFAPRSRAAPLEKDSSPRRRLDGDGVFCWARAPLIPNCCDACSTIACKEKKY